MHKIRAKRIDDVIDIMNAIINQCVTKGDRLGHFCGLYRMVTLAVKQKCDAGFFEDNERMRELDTMFANRYFDALAAYRRRESLTESWRVAFDAAQNPELMIMQHLLLGMNAHINLDLGIATAEVSGGILTDSLRRDFDRLNDILTELSERVQAEIVQVSPMFRRFEPLYRYFDEMFVRVGISSARTRAWRFAEQLVAIPYEEWELIIEEKDRAVAQVGTLISSPRANLIPLIGIVSRQEKKDIHAVVSILSEESWNRPLYLNREQVRDMARKRGINLDDLEDK